MRLLHRGAEADIYATSHGPRRAILKARRPRRYVNARLDARLRRSRTVREAQMLAAIKEFGVAAPIVFDLDVGSHRITMQRIEGTVVGTLGAGKLRSACAEIGRMAARLHANGVVHGDMTTSNFIASGRRTFVVDLGLASRSTREEDCAVDLRVFKEVLNSAHAADAGPSWRAFVSSYAPALGRAKFARVSRIVADIERRGRYATVT